MSYKISLLALVVLGSSALFCGSAQAERVPSMKVQPDINRGARYTIFVPYTTNGYSTLGVYQGVSPRIYRSPIVNDPINPQARAVFNLPFYGGSQAFGDKSEGAVSRPKPPISP